MNFILSILIITISGCATITSITTQKITPFVNNIINACIDDCHTTSNETDCEDLCTTDTLQAINEYHDEIIKKYGNVL